MVRQTARDRKLANITPVLFFGIEKASWGFGDPSYSWTGLLSRAVMPEFLARRGISRGGQIQGKAVAAGAILSGRPL
jgi:hypothetical protein